MVKSQEMGAGRQLASQSLDQSARCNHGSQTEIVFNPAEVVKRK